MQVALLSIDWHIVGALPMTAYLEKSRFKRRTPAGSLLPFRQAPILLDTFHSLIFIIPRDSVDRFALFVPFFSWEHSHMRFSHSFPTRDFLKGFRCAIRGPLSFSPLSPLLFFVHGYLFSRFLRETEKISCLVIRLSSRVAGSPSRDSLLKMRIAVRLIKRAR